MKIFLRKTDSKEIQIFLLLSVFLPIRVGCLVLLRLPIG